MENEQIEVAALLQKHADNIATMRKEFEECEVGVLAQAQIELPQEDFVQVSNVQVLVGIRYDDLLRDLKALGIAVKNTVLDKKRMEEWRE